MPIGCKTGKQNDLSNQNAMTKHVLIKDQIRRRNSMCDQRLRFYIEVGKSNSFWIKLI